MNIAAVFQIIAVMAWVAFGAVLLMYLARSSRNQNAGGLGRLTVIMVVVAVLLTSVGAGLVFVEPYEAGVVVTPLVRGAGMRPQPLQAGLHWIVPFIERVVRYPISVQTYTMARTASEGETTGSFTVEARTSDGQRIFVDSSTIYRIDPTRILDIHRQWQNRYQADLIQPRVRGTIRDSVSQYRVEEVLSTRRFEMASQITETLRGVLEQNGLILVDFVLRDITFTDEYGQSIEQKQIAEQLALQAAFVVQQRKQEAEQARQVAQGQADAAVIAAKGAAEARLIEANAEAQANQLLAASLTPTLLQYQYIIRLAPGVQTIFIPTDNQFILPLPSPTP